MKARLILSNEMDGYVYLDMMVESVGTEEPNPAYLIHLVSEKAVEHLARIATAVIEQT